MKAISLIILCLPALFAAAVTEAAPPLLQHRPGACLLYADSTRYILEEAGPTEHRRLLIESRRDRAADPLSLILKQALWNAARYRNVPPAAARDITLGACLGPRREAWQHQQYTGPH